MKRVLYIILMMLLFSGCENSLFEDRNDNPEYNFNAFWHKLDRNYSFFTYTKINWESVYSVYRPQVTSRTSINDLFKIFTQIADLLNDAHTNVFTPMGVTGNTNYFEKYPINQIDISDSNFEHLTVNRVFEYGKFKTANIGYVRIKSFDGENKNFEEIDSVLHALTTADGLIIDIRSNRGGYISNSEIVASRLADSTRIACKYRVRNGPRHTDFSGWIDVSVTPSKTGEHYHKPIAILTNRNTYSAAEWFVLLARAMPNVTIVGDTTGGGSAQTLIRELPNGWILRTSNTQTLLPSGSDFQFTGLYPNVPVWISPQDSAKEVDTILEKAISIVKSF